jgi:NADH-quinone oxidoreductase subunit J
VTLAAAATAAAHALTVPATAAHHTLTTTAAETHGFLSPTGVEVAFLLVGLVTFGAALVSVTTRQLVHAALWLVVTLGGLAVEYLLLTAEFIAWVQVLIYVGSVVVLLLFGLMLTKAPIGRSPDADSGNTAVTGASLFQNWVLPFEALSVLLLAALVGAIVLSRKAKAESSSPPVNSRVITESSPSAPDSRNNPIEGNSPVQGTSPAEGTSPVEGTSPAKQEGAR